MTQEITVLNDRQLSQLESDEKAIESVLEACSVVKLREMSVMRQSVELSVGLKRLRAILTDQVMDQIFMPLQGSKLGFTCDDKGPYPREVVRDVLIEGMIKGLRPVGNEITIIARQMYAAVNGVERLVTTFPGLSDLWLTPGVPQMAGDKGAFVPYHATWVLNGQPMNMVRDVEKREDGTMTDTRICVKVNSGMGPDAIIGKARRKMLFAIYQRISNSSFALRDPEDALEALGVPVPSETAAPPPVPPEQDGKRMKLGQKPVTPPPVEQPPMREPGQEG